jgi:energy-coupling factor transporter ATP-binding protein EcfA2
LEGYATSVAAFEARREQLQNTLEELQPLRNLALELEVAIQHLESFEDAQPQLLDNQIEIQLPENNEPQMNDQDFTSNRQAMNIEQRRLFQYINNQIDREVSGEVCPPLRIFVTGSAGTGKSFTLKMIAELIKRRYRILDQNACFVRVCAYTGVAAILIGGQTLHSVFRLKVQKRRSLPDLTPLTGFYAEQMKRQFQHVRFVIIDEVSMLPYEYLYQINLRLQELKGCQELFGGVNVLLFGDLMQLPPVIGTPIYLQPEEMEGTLHLFHQFNFCELTEIVRQRGDSTFVDLLNNLREGRMTVEQYEVLQNIQINSKQEGPFGLGQAIRVMPTNRMVTEHNSTVLRADTNQGIQLFEISAQDRLLEQDSRRINIPLENIIPTDINKTAGVPKNLTVYRGLRVMLRYNVDISRRLVNGSMGMIINIEFPGWRRQQLYNEDIPRVQIEFDNGVGTHWIDPINKIVTCHIPDEKEDSELHELVKSCQMHRHTTSCFKKSTHCRFGFPRKPSPETNIIDASTENTEHLIRNGGRICVLERSEGEEFVNNYNPELLRLWRANMDIQPCGSAMAIAYYITKYVSKSEPSYFDKSLREAIAQINQNVSDPLQKIFRSVMEMFNRRQVSIGECALRLCNLKYKMSSRKSVFINSRSPDKRYSVISFNESNEEN